MKIGINPKYADKEMQSFLKKLPEIFEVEGETLHAGRNTLKCFVLPSTHRVVVKRFKKPNFIQTIAYSFFLKTKAMRAIY